MIWEKPYSLWDNSCLHAMPHQHGYKICLQNEWFCFCAWNTPCNNPCCLILQYFCLILLSGGKSRRLCSSSILMFTPWKSNINSTQISGRGSPRWSWKFLHRIDCHCMSLFSVLQYDQWNSFLHQVLLWEGGQIALCLGWTWPYRSLQINYE